MRHWCSVVVDMYLSVNSSTKWQCSVVYSIVAVTCTVRYDRCLVNMLYACLNEPVWFGNSE